ncbi:hypothetical protein IKW75_01145 [Candidatus Saccharibacteria bacterium]|nr:hypothetical protein [Candidatus Saccharibacteria bacterium]
MVTKAESLKSIDGLRLSTRTATYLIKRFGSTESIVRRGRLAAYKYGLQPELLEKAPKWEQELIFALKKRGFVRPIDDFPITLNIGAFYALIYEGYKNAFVSSINQLDNEQYEKFEPLDYDKISLFRSKLRSALSGQNSLKHQELQYNVICYRFGLATGVKHSRKETSEKYNITEHYVGVIERAVINRLKTSNALPTIFSSEEVWEKVDELIDKLIELHKDPVFKEERILIGKLEEIAKVPISGAHRAEQYLKFYC